MRFRPGANLDTSQISDRRGLGLPIVGGGGVVGVVIFLLTVFAGGDPSTLTPPTLDQPGQTSNLAAECRTGADANARQDCRIVGVVNSVQAYWQSTIPDYRPAETVFFTGGVQSACGAATSAVGPFYCPTDERVYIDLGFFEDLRTRFGASGGPFAEAYVIAHEYGHHVEHLTEVLRNPARAETGSHSDSVRTELMADCLAGVWASNATQTGFIEELTPQDIADGLDAAAAIGDDRIQQRTQGRVDPESWTHGSAEQRQRWFGTGYRTGSIPPCNTFRVDSL